MILKHVIAINWPKPPHCRRWDTGSSSRQDGRGETVAGTPESEHLLGRASRADSGKQFRSRLVERCVRSPQTREGLNLNLSVREMSELPLPARKMIVLPFMLLT
jgi:hypothetical protein